VSARPTRLIGAVLVVLVLAGCSWSTGTSPANRSSAGGGGVDSVGVTTYPLGQRPAIAELAGPTLAGAVLSLSSLRGRVVVLNAWASYCQPCREESPALARIAASMADSGVRFVGLDEQDQAQSARAFVQRAGVTYPQLVDQDGSLLARLRIVPPSAVPSTLVLDRDGLVAARVIGPIDPTTFLAVVRQVAGL
jgi:thiol-disulfide isomerase/thioredoxin